MAKSSASSMPCSRTATSSRRKSSRSPSSGWIASWPPSSLPIAYGLPGRRPRHARNCCGPCDGCGRWGGSAGNRERRSPSRRSAAGAGSRRRRYRGVSGRRFPSEETARTNWRSAPAVAPPPPGIRGCAPGARAGRPDATVRRSAPPATAPPAPRRSGRPAGVRPAAHRRRRSPDRRARRSAAAVRRPRAAPGPAAGVRHAWHAIRGGSRQNGSIQASIRKYRRPQGGVRNCALQKSLPSGSSGRRRSAVSPTRRQTTSAPSTSWPSAKIRAARRRSRSLSVFAG